jgi:hypothetical protein
VKINPITKKIDESIYSLLSSRKKNAKVKTIMLNNKFIERRKNPNISI